ncbi:MAG: 2-phospho-L-lactate guanylyltransferase [Candidatus Limnocylindria bacterium]
MDAGLIPVKRLEDAKSRLGESFGEATRARVAAALLENALALCAAADFLEWWVVTGDAAVAERADAGGIGALPDPGDGLNAALSLAARALTERGAASVTIVPCDVPLAMRADIEDIVDTGATSEMVVVPSARDGGTNALYLRPPDLTPPRFGSASVEAHLASAHALGVRCSILELPRLALDLDTAEDVEAFLDLAPDGGPAAALARALRA